jgi:DNA modification methylase
MTPWLDDGDVRLFHGEALSVLAGLPSESVHCICTSPPYWGLRSYLDDGHADKPLELGLEATPGEYVERLVVTLREARRVLRHDGTLWLNLGDSYNAGRNGEHAGGAASGFQQVDDRYQGRSGPNVAGLKPKDLCGVPWRVAFALQDDGWWLRSDIIWSKPNPMPESVTDRPTRSHEYVFLLTKSARYFYDADAIREPNRPDVAGRNRGNGKAYDHRATVEAGWSQLYEPNPAGRNRRSVWTIATAPYAEAHFATFPPKLVEPCIMAGTSEAGCCAVCGAPRRRVVEREPDTRKPYRTEGAGVKASGAGRNDGVGLRKVLRGDGRGGDLATAQTRTLGWEPSCEHECPECLGSGTSPRHFETVEPCATCDGRGTAVYPTKPCTVLDPFAGSGTTMLVARQHGRRSIGIDLNEEYLALAARRLQQQSLFFAMEHADDA